MAGKLLNEAQAVRYLIDALNDEAVAELLNKMFIENKISKKLPRKKEGLISFLKSNYKEVIKIK